MNTLLVEALIEAVLRVVLPILGVATVRAKIDAWELAEQAAEAASRAKFGS